MQLTDASHQIVADLLAERTGQQLTQSRMWRVETALSAVYRECGISNIDQLVCLLDQQTERQLPGKVVEALLNNETYFYRDKPTFDQLPETVLPLLAQARERTRKLSIWCAGCSTGQEALSLAMLFADQAADWADWTIDILGTDVSGKAISAAQSGHYSQFEVQRGLSVSQMLRHFREEDGGWKIDEKTVANVSYRQHNILTEPPANTHFDLILCRNVLLYFDAGTRARAFDRLHRAVAADGFLMLGAGETVVGQTNVFSHAPGLASLYQPVARHEQKLREAGFAAAH